MKQVKKLKVDLLGKKKIPLMYGLGILAFIFMAVGVISGIHPSKYAMQKGDSYFDEKVYDLGNSLRWYRIASVLSPGLSSPHFQMARIYFVTGRLDDAEREADLALQRNPNNDRSYYQRGLIRGYAKNYSGAQADFQEFVNRKPNEWAGYNDLAWSYFQDKQYERAREVAEKGIGLFPENTWLLNGLGATLIELGETDRANEVLAKASKNSEKLTTHDWQLSNPSNDPGAAENLLAIFQNDVQNNLDKSRMLGLGKPVFRDACASMEVKICNGATCGSTWCTDESEYGAAYACPASTCSADSDCVPVVNGECGTRHKRFAAIATFADWAAPSETWCSKGTQSFPTDIPNFPGIARVTNTWSCIGSGPNHTDVTTCQAAHYPDPPTVSLAANPPSLMNVIFPKTTTLDWSIDNASLACGADASVACYCSVYHNGSAILNNLLYPDTKSNAVTISSAGTHTFKVVCTNPKGVTAEASRSVVATACVCDQAEVATRCVGSSITNFCGATCSGTKDCRGGNWQEESPN